MTITGWLLLLTVLTADGLHTAAIPYDAQFKCELARELLIDQATRMIEVKSLTATCVPENGDT